MGFFLSLVYVFVNFSTYYYMDVIRGTQVDGM
jgi:hypothetical protein